MAVCESQLDSGLARVRREGSDENSQERPIPAGLPLTVDYRSPVSHFVPPAVELYAARQKQEQVSSADSAETSTPIKRKRGRPRVDKTSPEYLANLAARKQAREMGMTALELGSRAERVQEYKGNSTSGFPSQPNLHVVTLLDNELGAAAMLNPERQPEAPLPGGKRKRGRPRIDKTSPEYLARKHAREMEALERKAKREYKRRGTADSGASSSTGDTTPRVKRKYTKRNPGVKKDGTPQSDKVKGKRGRPRKDQMQNRPPAGQIRVRSNLMPATNEPISLDSDEEPDLGSPGAASDSLSLDENLRALRHIHEKYANIDKDDMFDTHLLAANFKKPPIDGQRIDEDGMSIRSEGGSSRANRREGNGDRVEKLEDSSNSDSDSSSSGSGSSSSGSSSSSSSGSSDSSDSSDSESEQQTNDIDAPQNSTYPTPPWAAPAYPPAESGSDSEPDPEQLAAPAVVSHDEISESDNESPDKSFQCHICKKWYSTRVTLKIHRRSHQNRGSGTGRSRARGSDRYECDICNERFPRREKLYTHKSEAHRGAMTFRCSVCRRCFEHDDELAAHRNTHTQDEIDGRCSHCPCTFETYEQLKRHALTAHSPPRVTSPGALHVCTHCGKKFTHLHSLTRHLQNHAKQLYRCVVCKASFARADQLAQHLNSHLDNYKRLKP